MIPPNISQFNLSLFHLPSLYHCSCKNVFYGTVAVAGVIILVIKIISNVFVLWCLLLDCNLKQGSLKKSFEWQAHGNSPRHYTGIIWYLYRERRRGKSSMDCTSKWWTTSSYKTCKKNTVVRQFFEFVSLNYTFNKTKSNPASDVTHLAVDTYMNKLPLKTILCLP